MSRAVAVCTSCDAPIEWATDPKGKRIPVNADGDLRGNLAVQEVPGGKLTVRYLRKGDNVVTMHEWRATSHFASCPDAEKWRDRGRG